MSKALKRRRLARRVAWTLILFSVFQMSRMSEVSMRIDQAVKGIERCWLEKRGVSSLESGWRRMEFEESETGRACRRLGNELRGKAMNPFGMPDERDFDRFEEIREMALLKM